MTLTVQPVRTEHELKVFLTFPWQIYRKDPCWVPPLIEDFRQKLDPARSPFWKNARRELWIAWRDGHPVGTVAGIVDQGRLDALGEPIGAFGFFECIDDTEVARCLLDAAGEWLRAQGMTGMRGPYNPSADGECGILVEGFQTRPALLEGHNPAYYQRLVEEAGLRKYRDMVARLYTIDRTRTLEEQVSEKLQRVAERAGVRPDIHIRAIDLRRWDEDITLAWRIYTAALSELPEYVPVTLEDFQGLAASFRAILDPRLALVAEIGGQPVGFALALPDINEALQHVNGRLGPLQMLKLLWYSRRLKRVSFKILMMLPQYQGRGVEAVLTMAVARAIWEMGFREVDMSLTGEENEKSNRLQENLGFRMYRRYTVYQKDLA